MQHSNAEADTEHAHGSDQDEGGRAQKDMPVLPMPYEQRLREKCKGTSVLLHRAQLPLYYGKQGMSLPRLPCDQSDGTQVSVLLSCGE